MPQGGFPSCVQTLAHTPGVCSTELLSLCPAAMSPFRTQLQLNPVTNSSTFQNGSGLLLLVFAGQAKSSWVPLNWSIAKASWQTLLEVCQEGRFLRFFLAWVDSPLLFPETPVSPSLLWWFLALECVLQFGNKAFLFFLFFFFYR